MSATGLILGVINVAIVAALLLLFGAIVMMIMKWFGWPIDPMVQKFYLLFVVLVVLYMLVALVAGLPTWRIIPHASSISLLHA